MGGVDYIGSKGLQALLEALAACRSLGGDLKLAAVSPNVLHILRMIKFDELFSICEAVDQAVAEFG
jgi:anti-anti-sigma factor